MIRKIGLTVLGGIIGALAVLWVVTMVGRSEQTVAQQWYPRLVEENGIVCQKDDCSDDVRVRRMDLLGGLRADAEAAGPEYRSIANHTHRVYLAVAYWGDDCGAGSNANWFAERIAMDCDSALDLSLTGTDELETMLRDQIVRESR